MRKKGLFLILFVVLSMLTICVSSSFAQDIDVSNMDNAQLMALLQAIMEKLGDQDAGSGTQDADQLSADSSQQAEEAGGRIFSIYENKKLILERLPDYMFYQPPTEVPEKEGPKPTKQPDHYIGEPGVDETGTCTWNFYNGKWYCMKG